MMRFKARPILFRRLIYTRTSSTSPCESHIEMDFSLVMNKFNFSMRIRKEEVKQSQ